MAELQITRDPAGRIERLALHAPNSERHGATLAMLGAAIGGAFLAAYGLDTEQERLALIGGGAAVAFALLFLLRLVRRAPPPATLRLLADAEGLYGPAAGAPLPWSALAGFNRELRPQGLEPVLVLLALPLAGGAPLVLADSAGTDLPALEAALEEFQAQQAAA